MREEVLKNIITEINHNQPSCPNFNQAAGQELYDNTITKNKLDHVISLIQANKQEYTTFTALSGHKLSISAWQSIFNALQQNTHITTLDLSKCDLGSLDNQILDLLANLLVNNHRINKIILRSNKLEPAHIEQLMQILQQPNCAIRCLSLKNNQLTDISNIANMLAKNRSLNALDLSDNNIASTSIPALAQALKLNDYLVVLNLGNNNINYADTFMLAFSIKYNPHSKLIAPVALGLNPQKFTYLQAVVARNKKTIMPWAELVLRATNKLPQSRTTNNIPDVTLAGAAVFAWQRLDNESQAYITAELQKIKSLLTQPTTNFDNNLATPESTSESASPASITSPPEAPPIIFSELPSHGVDKHLVPTLPLYEDLEQYLDQTLDTITMQPAAKKLRLG